MKHLKLFIVLALAVVCLAEEMNKTAAKDTKHTPEHSESKTSSDKEHLNSNKNVSSSTTMKPMAQSKTSADDTIAMNPKIEDAMAMKPKMDDKMPMKPESDDTMPMDAMASNATSMESTSDEEMPMKNVANEVPMDGMADDNKPAESNDMKTAASLGIGIYAGALPGYGGYGYSSFGGYPYYQRPYLGYSIRAAPIPVLIRARPIPVLIG